MNRLTVDAVIVTRNRPEALALSLPLLVSQSRRPEKIIIVDSSDDPIPTASVVKSAARPTDVPIALVRAERGIPLQRNVGLKRVTSDVVLFPDDDSLLLPGALDAMMQIYERDAAGTIGGVCAAEATNAPAGILETAKQTYSMRPFDAFKRAIAGRRYPLESRFFPDPFLIHGRSRWNVRPTPPWLSEENAVLVEYMSGFRMSFRTNLIKQYGFDEALINYAYHEDRDASFGIFKSHLLVGARNAQIYHHKAPDRRDNGLTLGVTQTLNRAYIICRHAEPSSAARAALIPHSRYKIFQYAMGSASAFGRQRLLGALRAHRFIPDLTASSPNKLTASYKNALGLCLK